MDDMPILYVGLVRVPDDMLLSWRAAVEFVFAERDLKVMQRSGLDRRVARVLKERAPSHSSSYIFLLAAPQDVRARLDVHGYTQDHCRTVWHSSRDELSIRYRRRAKHDAESLSARQAELEQLTWEEWVRLIRERSQSGYSALRAGGSKRLDPMTLLGLCGDPLVSLRLLLDALNEPVWRDCDYLYAYQEGTSASPHRLAREDKLISGRWPEGRITVLTEGRSDARLISAGLRALHPELLDAYQFLDFDEFKIEGGASPLARMVKVLSGARMSSRILGLFDNDAAGHEALEQLADLRLPSNVRVMTLPPIPLARRYPTCGPSGTVTMDVNGSAAAIELYLGRKALSASGSLRPVRWLEWRSKIGRYQGAVEGKQAVAEAFQSELAKGGRPADLRRQYPDMNRLLIAMFAAFQDLKPSV